MCKGRLYGERFARRSVGAMGEPRATERRCADQMRGGGSASVIKASVPWVGPSMAEQASILALTPVLRPATPAPKTPFSTQHLS